jgi:hypothetical protein
LLFVYLSISTVPGADPGFQIRGEHLKKLRLAEGGAKIVGVFRVKNHDFTPKNHFFSNFRGARAGCSYIAMNSLKYIISFTMNYFFLSYVLLMEIRDILIKISEPTKLN